MMGGLTERKMNNKRFRQTEEVIFEVFFGTSEELKIKDLAKKTGFSRATLYRHHKTANRIIPDYECYIYRRFLKAINRFDFDKNVDVRLFFYQMLSFIIVYKKVFKVFFAREKTEVVKKMIGKSRAMVALKYHMPKNAEIIFEVYVNEILGVVENWGKGGFLEGRVDIILNNIVYLTETARKRLMPLNN